MIMASDVFDVQNLESAENRLLLLILQRSYCLNRKYRCSIRAKTRIIDLEVRLEPNERPYCK